MEDWIIGMMLALFIIVPCWMALSRRKETIRQIEAWSELAGCTGLAFTPGYPIGIRGEYRGRYLYLTLFTFGDSEHNTAFYQNTKIYLNVMSMPGMSLSIQARRMQDYLFQNQEIFSGNNDFDRKYVVTGSPREYAQKAVNMIAQSDQHLLMWILRNLPFIELREKRLVCVQNGELTNINDQIALVNLLCDLADLAETMGRDNINYSVVRREWLMH